MLIHRQACEQPLSNLKYITMYYVDFEILYHFVQFGSHASRTPSRTPNSHARHADFGQVPKTFSKVKKSMKNALFFQQKQIFYNRYASKNVHTTYLPSFFAFPQRRVCRKKKAVTRVLAARRNQNFGRPVTHHAVCRIEQNGTVKFYSKIKKLLLIF